MAPDAELPPTVAAALARLDALVERFEEHPDPLVQGEAVELLQCVDLVHRAGLERLAAVLEGAGALPHARQDPAIALLFELYGLAGEERILAGPRHAPVPGRATASGFVPLASLQVAPRRGQR